MNDNPNIFSEKDHCTDIAIGILSEELIFAIFINNREPDNDGIGTQYWDTLGNYLFSSSVSKIKVGVDKLYKSFNTPSGTINPIFEFHTRLITRLMSSEIFMLAVENCFQTYLRLIESYNDIGIETIFDIKENENENVQFKLMLFFYIHNDSVARVISENRQTLLAMSKERKKIAEKHK